MTKRTVALVMAATLVFGWLVGPRIASAVGSLVTIQNAAGTQKAGVTKAQQLQTAEAAPSSFREFRTSTSDNQCHVVVSVPANKGFVIRSISMVVLTASSTGLPASLLYPNATCTNPELYAVPTVVTGSHDLTVGPGFAVRPGGHLSFNVGSDSAVAVYVWGYLVPKSDAPSTTPIG